MSIVTLVVARAENGAIGFEGKLPWHLPEDLRHFKAVTMGGPMVMGRKTFESLPGLLPGRRHIVLTRQPDWRAEGAEVVNSLSEAIVQAGEPRVSVIGGADIFRLFQPIADSVELTEVHDRPEADTFIPDFDPGHWREVGREAHPARGGRPAFSFVRLVRKDRSGGVPQ